MSLVAISIVLSLSASLCRADDKIGIRCEAPPNPENGRAIYKTLEYGAKLQYECYKGYILKASDERICLETGLWSGKEPECLGLENVMPTLLQKNCVEVHLPTGNKSMGSRRLCLPIKKESRCEYPRAPLHGTMDLAGGKTTVGSIVIYSCSHGYKLYGSATSKCLHTGNWTFPPPLCLEPCEVPDVEHGSLGIYENGLYRKIFKQLQVWPVIEDGKELYLKCSKKYAPGGSSESEIKITCSSGKWFPEPICKPAACRGPPPLVPNAYVVPTEHDHGTVLIYRCNRDYVKSIYGLTICEFGEWIGEQPVCTDSRCYTTSLRFSGLSLNGKRIFRHNEVFIPQCVAGFELSKPEDNKLTCVNGVWQGQFPPCKPARCYVKDLKGYEGVYISDAEPTLPGDFGNITCRKGYVFMHAKQPQCSNGSWQLPDSVSPCKPGPCFVHYVHHGQLNYVHAYRKYNWRKVRFDTITEYLKEKIGSIYDHGSELYLSCEKPYIFQGRDSASVIKVQCLKQEWIPHPACLLPNYAFLLSLAGESVPVETTTLEPENVSFFGSNQVASVTESFLTRGEASTFTNVGISKDEIEPSQPIEEVTLIPDSLFENNTVNFTVIENPLDSNGRNCSCIYNLNDEDIVAYVGTEQLQFNSEVKHGSIIQFTCKNIGYHRFIGNAELHCKNCMWRSSQFPTCAKPRKGDAVVSIHVNDSSLLSATPTGVMKVPKGTTLTVSCTIKDSAVWPRFLKLPYGIEPQYRYEVAPTQDYIFMADLLLRNVDSSYSRKYECGSTNGRSNYIEIEVTDVGCTALETPPELTVFYTNRNRVTSHAVFECNKPYVLQGASTITCLANGTWSDEMPICSSVFCSMQSLMEELPENLAPRIEDVTGPEMPYGTVLTLECVLQGLFIVGPHNVTCSKDGSWSVGNVMCVQGCPSLQVLDDSYLVIQPVKEFYRFGEFVIFSCPPGLTLSTDVERMVCLRDGWSEQDIPSCRELNPADLF